MNSFKDFDIKVEPNGFVGDKVKMERVMNREITVYRFRIVDSKLNTGKRLDMQISIGDDRRVLWTGSNTLMDMINRVPNPNGFPFKTTIVKEGDRLIFT